jgi:hypothetical protein
MNWDLVDSRTVWTGSGKNCPSGDQNPTFFFHKKNVKIGVKFVVDFVNIFPDETLARSSPIKSLLR